MATEDDDSPAPRDSKPKTVLEWHQKERDAAVRDFLRASRRLIGLGRPSEEWSRVIRDGMAFAEFMSRAFSSGEPAALAAARLSKAVAVVNAPLSRKSERKQFAVEAVEQMGRWWTWRVPNVFDGILGVAPPPRRNHKLARRFEQEQELARRFALNHFAKLLSVIDPAFSSVDADYLRSKLERFVPDEPGEGQLSSVGILTEIIVERCRGALGVRAKRLDRDDGLEYEVTMAEIRTRLSPRKKSRAKTRKRRARSKIKQ